MEYEVVEIAQREKSNWVIVDDNLMGAQTSPLRSFLAAGWDLIHVERRLLPELKRETKVYILRTPKEN